MVGHPHKGKKDLVYIATSIDLKSVQLNREQWSSFPVTVAVQRHVCDMALTLTIVINGNRNSYFFCGRCYPSVTVRSESAGGDIREVHSNVHQDLHCHIRVQSFTKSIQPCGTRLIWTTLLIQYKEYKVL